MHFPEIRKLRAVTPGSVLISKSSRKVLLPGKVFKLTIWQSFKLYRPYRDFKRIVRHRFLVFDMSAYALPGLFPPIEYAKPRADTSSSASSSISGSLSKGPLHATEDRSSSNLANFLKDRFAPLKASSSGTEDIKEAADGSVYESCIGIVVKEAKIDPVRLVQALTKLPRQKPLNGKVLRRKSSPELCIQTSDSAKAASPHDDAIEFELSINLHGRKYSARRTLQSIMNLRSDLMREMNARSQNLESPEIEIPEIPPIADDEGSGGLVGRGFMMLHALLNSYCPVMERWLRNVITVVPDDSECLINFLWEPLSTRSTLDFSKVSWNLDGLGSIKEGYDCGDTEYDDSDEDDEW